MTNHLRQLIIRADAGHAIGVGHVMRCLAVAQAMIARGGEVLLFGRIEDGIVQRARAEGLRVECLPDAATRAEDLARLLEAATPHAAAAAVLVDGYSFDEAYLEALSSAGIITAMMDDYNHLPAYPVDVLVNPNPHAHTLRYATPAHTALLLGGAYTPLRREFTTAQQAGPQPQTARRLLVTAGGSDPEGLTLAVARSLVKSALPHLDVRIVLGPAYRERTALEKALSGAPFLWDIRQNVSDMAELMAWTHLAVTAGGSTCHELACLGVPFIVCPVAENQQGLSRGYADNGAALLLDPQSKSFTDALAGTIVGLVSDQPLRQSMSEEGKRMMDGRGAMRILESIDTVAHNAMRGNTHV